MRIWLTALLPIAFLLSCSGSTDAPYIPPVPLAEATIGPEGGTLETEFSSSRCRTTRTV